MDPIGQRHTESTQVEPPEHRVSGVQYEPGIAEGTQRPVMERAKPTGHVQIC